MIETGLSLLDLTTLRLVRACSRKELGLGVERRGIYDIVNLLESVGVLARKAQNRYAWNGFQAIPKVLDVLKVLVRKIPPDPDDSVGELVEHFFLVNHPDHCLTNQGRDRYGKREVNDRGRIELGGALKVTTGYGEKVYAAPRISEDSIETTDYEVKECTAVASVVNEEQIVPTVTEAKTTPPGSKMSPNITKNTSPLLKISPANNARVKVTVPQPFSLATEKRSPCVTSCCGSAEKGNCGITCSRKANTRSSPSATKSPQSHSPLLLRKLWQVDNKKHVDDEDNWSIGSSVIASVRTNKFKTTVGSAPTFRSSERAERRKEYYVKLEEKHQALAAEKSQCEARTKEEQEVAIKQMRKNMVVKANHVPSFYQEGPPPKVELRKI